MTQESKFNKTWKWPPRLNLDSCHSQAHYERVRKNTLIVLLNIREDMTHHMVGSNFQDWPWYRQADYKGRQYELACLRYNFRSPQATLLRAILEV